MKALHILTAAVIAAASATAEDAPAGIVHKDEATAWGDRAATVLVFLFPDCPVANRYSPEITAIFDDYREKGVAFYRVYAGSHIDAEAVETHTREYRHQFPAVLDPELELVRLTGAKVTPEAVVYDADGRQHYRGRINNRYVDFGQYRPEATVHDLRDALDAVLEGRPVAEPVTRAIGCFLPTPPERETETEDASP